MSIAQSEASEDRKLPIIDISGLHGIAVDRGTVARELRLACTNTGFFYITGHGISTGLVDRIFQQSREFFALPMEQKLALSMTQSACRHGLLDLEKQRVPDQFWTRRLLADKSRPPPPTQQSGPRNLEPRSPVAGLQGGGAGGSGAAAAEV